ncbi:hypothetical protein COCVIDRAFT_85454 [Bipolaris victoriae FI3]|uniref:Oxidase FUB9 n=1 Tax=Bipolaris victoriae (strain FI3) TaxID=930091 RepID=W7EPW2_BIPV3|nr:hypothetical protein COCVIDRAFT_85454 [Bipolaris victoriae FI3]
MSPKDVPTPYTLADVKEIAKIKLPDDVWEYLETGADDNWTVSRNEDIYKRLLLRPRMLRNVSAIDTTTSIFGKRYNIPIALAPSAYYRFASNGGELDSSAASFDMGKNFTLSSNATTSLEDVMQSLPPRDDSYPKPWFQLYSLGSRATTAALVQRAEKTGFEALVLTIDTPVLGNRLHERRHSLELPKHLTILLLNARTAAEARRAQEEKFDFLVDASLQWSEFVPWLRSQTKMKLVVKGVMTGEDAELAMQAGADAIIVSNHGGRQLDGVPSTLEVLGEVVNAVRGRIPIMLDGGIRRGGDVFKALVLGADLVFVGGPVLWGLAYDGRKGVKTILDILERELTTTMTLAGASSIKKIVRSMLGVSAYDDISVAKL